MHPLVEEFGDAQMYFWFNTTVSLLQKNEFCFKIVYLFVSPTKLA